METEYTQPQDGIAPLVEDKKWYAPLTTVTTVSKYLALTLFIALPFIGFWYGMQYGGSTQGTVNETLSVVEQQKTSDDPDGVSSAEPKGGGPTETVVLPGGLSVTIDDESLSSGNGVFVLSGTAKEIDVIGVTVTGADGYQVFTSVDPVVVSDGRWSVEVSQNIPTDAPARPLLDGAYQITIFGPGESRLVVKTFIVGSGVADPEKPVELNFVAQPSIAGPDGKTTLFWRAVNATSCEASGDWVGEREVIGEEKITVSSTGLYRLTCTGKVGPVSQTVQLSR